MAGCVWPHWHATGFWSQHLRAQRPTTCPPTVQFFRLERICWRSRRSVRFVLDAGAARYYAMMLKLSSISASLNFVLFQHLQTIRRFARSSASRLRKTAQSRSSCSSTQVMHWKKEFFRNSSLIEYWYILWKGILIKECSCSNPNKLSNLEPGHGKI